MKLTGKKLTLYSIIFCFIIALLTFGGGDKYFYLFWGVTIFISFVYLLSIMNQGKIKRNYAELFLMLTMWMIYELVVTPWATNPDEHLKILLLTFLYTIFSIICAIYIGGTNNRFIKSIEVAIMVWIIINLIALLLNFIGIINYQGRSFSGVYFNRNTLATTGLLFLVFIIFLKAELIFLKADFCFGIILLSLIILILSTLSSKGLIGIIFISVVYLAFLKGLKRLIRVSITIFGSFLILFLILDLDITSRVKENISGFIGINQASEPGFVSASGKERNFLMNEGFAVAMKNPLTGIGVNNSKYHLFPESYYRRLAKGQNPESGMVSHNNYVEMLLNGGIPAFILYYFPIIYIIMLLFIKNRSTELTTNNLRKYFMVSIFVKLVMDVGMVNYMNFPYIFIIASSYIFYYNHFKIKPIAKELDKYN